MTPKEFIQKQDNGYIAGDYTPAEVYQLMSDYAEYVRSGSKPDVSGSENIREQITSILYQNSSDDSEYMKIRFEQIQTVIDEIITTITKKRNNGY